MTTTVSVLVSGKRETLSASSDVVPTLPAAYAVFEVEVEPGSEAPALLLDGRTIPVIRGAVPSRGTAVVDLFRSVGFHMLRVGTDEFLFATEDGKLRLDGIKELLKFLGREGLGWGYQLFFADGVAIRDAKVDYAWLSDAGPRILECARAIAERPRLRQIASEVVGTPGGRRVIVSPTMTLLRRDPSRLLEETESGPLAVGGRRYSPRLVVAAERKRSVKTACNVRAARLLTETAALTELVLSDREITPEARARLRVLGTALVSALDLHPFDVLRSSAMQVPDEPTTEELSDSRYEESYALYRDLTTRLAWSPSATVDTRFAYVKYSDQLYQAFVACALARAFDAQQVGGALRAGAKGPAFRSTRFELYYDTEPPEPDFKNWRNDSLRPAALTPDLIIVDRERSRGLILDAKYRVSAAGNLDPDALTSAHVYMQTFGRKASGICFPGPAPSLQVLEGDSNRIVELSIGPYGNLAEFLRDVARPVLESLMEPLSV